MQIKDSDGENVFIVSDKDWNEVYRQIVSLLKESKLTHVEIIGLVDYVKYQALEDLHSCCKEVNAKSGSHESQTQ